MDSPYFPALDASHAGNYDPVRYFAGLAEWAMNSPLRKPAAAAAAYAASPAAAITAMYRRVWETSMHDMPFVNPALAVAAVGFRRHAGDFLNLFLLPGGGCQRPVY